MTQTPNARIGREWESAVRDHLIEEHGIVVKRLAHGGTRDIGDLTGVDDFIIGCKNEKTIRLSKYMDDLQKQRANLFGGQDLIPIEIVKRRGKGPGRAYVVVELDEFAPLMRAVAGE